MMMVPEAANMPPTPWHTEILAPGFWAGAVPRIWRTFSCRVHVVHAGMDIGEAAAIVLSSRLPPEAVLCSAMKAPAPPRGN